jgi:sulfonate transport system permease protein
MTWQLKSPRCKLLPPVAVLAIWQMFAWLVSNPRLLPDPEYVATVSLPSIGAFDGSEGWSTALHVILLQSSITLARIGISLPIGVLAGVALALLVHLLDASGSNSAVIMRAVQAVPLFALIPLFLQWFGGREVGVVLYIIVGIAVVASANAYNAVKNVKPEYIFQARLCGATRVEVFTTVYLAAIQPEMVGSMRTILGFAGAFSLGAEYLASNSGIGFLVYQSYLYSDTGKLIIFSMLYGVYSLIFHAVSRPLLRQLRRGRTAERTNARLTRP